LLFALFSLQANYAGRLARERQPVRNAEQIAEIAQSDYIWELFVRSKLLVLSIHSLNPDHLTTVAEIKASLGRK
jgi:hypothetical protein